MAKRLAMIRPLPMSVGLAGGPALPLLATPDPKETATFVAGTYQIDVDLGAALSVDSYFLGYVPAGSSCIMSGGLAGAGEFFITSSAPIVLQASDLVTPTWHLSRVDAAPVTARYVRFTVTIPAGGGTIGAVAVGKAVQPTWGHEFGAGRPIEDTGIVDRLFSGGFGIYNGVRVGGYQWQFGDLSDAELSKLYALSRDRGQTQTLLVIEDPDQTDGLNERVHWSLFDRIEAYERQVPGASRYAFKVRDWA